MRGAQLWQSTRARILRANEISANVRLRNQLRSRRFGGLKFVRQAPVAGFSVDFLCREQRIISKIDDGTHGVLAEVAADARLAGDCRGLDASIASLKS